MTTPNGMEIIESGWTASGVQDAMKVGSKGLPPIDPFEDIDPLIKDNEAANEANQQQAICALTADKLSLGYLHHEESENDDSDWEWEHERGDFNTFEDCLSKHFIVYSS